MGECCKTVLLIVLQSRWVPMSASIIRIGRECLHTMHGWGTFEALRPCMHGAPEDRIGMHRLSAMIDFFVGN